MRKPSIFIVGYIQTTTSGYNVIGYDVTNPDRPMLLPTPWPATGEMCLFDRTHEQKTEAVAIARDAVQCLTKWGWAAMYVGDLVGYFNKVWKRDAATAERFRTANG